MATTLQAFLGLLCCTAISPFAQGEAPAPATWRENGESSDPWDDVRSILAEGVHSRIFPGAVGLVWQYEKGVIFQHAQGNLTYGEDTPLGNANSPVTLETVFDMASCSKVVAATTAVALLNQSGFLPLDQLVSEILPGFEVEGKEKITIRNCLLHNAGFPPDPTPNNFWQPEFGCSGAPLPAQLSFNCSDRAYAAILKQQLRPGAVVGGAYVYSDISFLTLMYVVGKVALREGLVHEHDYLAACHSFTGHAFPGSTLQCAYEAFVRLHVFETLGAQNTLFRPPETVWPNCAPTTVPVGEPAPAHGTDLQGKVEDGNAYMLGGIAGHAGVFSTVNDLVRITSMWMGFGDATGTPQILNAETIASFTHQYNHSQSSRALGWNTNDVTAQPDGGWNASCGNLSATTFTHVGYTGTQICADPSRSLFTILLTARVYHPAPSGIHGIRQSFNDAVLRVLAGAS